MMITTTPTLTPANVHETLGRHILADGYDMVLDIDRSHGRRLWDARRGRRVLDMWKTLHQYRHSIVAVSLIAHLPSNEATS